MFRRDARARLRFCASRGQSRLSALTQLRFPVAVVSAVWRKVHEVVRRSRRRPTQRSGLRRHARVLHERFSAPALLLKFGFQSLDSVERRLRAAPQRDELCALTPLQLRQALDLPLQLDFLAFERLFGAALRLDLRAVARDFAERVARARPLSDSM